MNKKNNLLDKLRKKYPELKFMFKEDDVFEYYLLYKEIDSSSCSEFTRPQFIDYLDDLCESILINEDLSDLVIVYDYLNEIEQ